MPRQRFLNLTVVALSLGLFIVLIFQAAQAGGKKEEGSPLKIDPPSIAEIRPDTPSPTPPPPVGLPPVPPPSIPPLPPQPPIKNSIWTFAMEMKDGRMHLTARTSGKEYKVACDNLEMQAPRGQVTAQGKVAIEGANLEATGEKLTIQFGADALLLEGKARVKCRSAQPQEVELTGERFTLRVNEARLADRDGKGKD